MSVRAWQATALFVLGLGLFAGTCGGGSGGGSGSNLGGSGMPPVAATRVCDGGCTQEVLSINQVNTVIQQAIDEATANGVAATIAVVDRVGNVLGVFRMAGASATTVIRSGKSVTSGLDEFTVDSALAAISKAGTAAYLSSQGNAFSTRTASQIVQEHFNPGESFQPGGPLFGVQFSQLPCGDLVRRFGLDAREGPKRMPLGFSADPGALPLYIQGVPVGGVGVELDGAYDADLDTSNFDSDVEERIAVAASASFNAPEDRLADRIAVLGKFLRYTDDGAVKSPPRTALVTALPAGLIAVTDFCAAVVTAGAELLTNASGVASTVFDGEPAEILVDTGGATFPATNPRDSTLPLPAGGGMTAAEVRVLIREALKIAASARAQIRRPAGSAARVNIAVVDLDGELLGFARSPDAPIFGIDVSLQKARTAAFFSSTTAAAELSAATGTGTPARFRDPGDYVTDLRTFLGDPTALANGVAFSDRAGGNLARPFFPDGIDGKPHGPFSKSLAIFSPFNTGLQLDLVADELLDALGDPARRTCADGILGSRLDNGLQIFPGSVPIWKGGVLVGGIGVSGDGVDQDDLVSFLGLHTAGQILGTIGNAPAGIRADTISVSGVNLRFVSCPPSPFLNSSAQNVCDGL